MSEILPVSIENLSNKLRAIPGVGKRSGQKLALDILNMEEEEFLNLLNAMEKMRKEVKLCKISGMLTQNEIAPMLLDSKRNQNQICIVEKPTDVISVEKSEVYSGVYHVLKNLISPLDNIFVDQTNIPLLFERLEKLEGEIELIFFLKTTFASEATQTFIRQEIEDRGMDNRVKITRLAQGLPLFFNTDYLDQATMIRALEDRKLILNAAK